MAGPGHRTAAVAVVVTVARGVAVAAYIRWGIVSLTIAVLGAGVALVIAGVRARVSRRGPVVGEVLSDAGVALMTGAVLGLVLYFAQNAVEEDRIPDRP